LPPVDSQTAAAGITDEDQTSFRSSAESETGNVVPTGSMTSTPVGVLSDTVHDVIPIHNMIGTKFTQPTSSLRSAYHGDDRCACL
jgi:hypothetical protein